MPSLMHIKKGVCSRHCRGYMSPDGDHDGYDLQNWFNILDVQLVTCNLIVFAITLTKINVGLHEFI